MRGQRGVTTRQEIVNYYDDVDRCRNCKYVVIRKRQRMIPTLYTPPRPAYRIDAYRCFLGNFPVSANGICLNHKRSEL